jgi:hypothetical protein
VAERLPPLLYERCEVLETDAGGQAGLQEEKTFSERMGYKKSPDRLIYEEAPLPVRQGLTWIIDKLCQVDVQRERASKRYFGSLSVLKAQYDYGQHLSHIAQIVGFRYRRDLTWDDLCRLIKDCPWNEYYDICEYVHTAFESRQTHIVFENELNSLFQDHGIGYQMNRGKVELFDSPITTNTVEQARLILQDAKFKGPAEQFEKAVAFISARPLPDRENCVKEAVSALEGVARIVSGDMKGTLGKILKTHFKTKIPGGLFKAFEGVWGYTSDAPGARHAKVGTEGITIEEAKLVLNLCAAMILYIAKLS